MRFFISVLFAMSPGVALACACCADKGERMYHDQEIGDYEYSELTTIGAQGRAHVFTTACDDCVEGIVNMQYDYPVHLIVDNNEVWIVLGEGSRISLPLPQSYTRFAVDMDPTKDGPPGLLFNEVRFKGTLNAHGDFAAANGAEGEFILTGRSNACWNAADFTHWSLDAKGEGVYFRLFGGVAVVQ